MRALAWILAFVSPLASAGAPVVFIHGIKGARLVDPQNKVRWLDGLQTLGFRSSALALPWSFAGGSQGKDDLKPEGSLEWIGVLPFIDVPVYGPWVAAAKEWGNFHVFAYDWRRENNETVLLFEKFLEQVSAQSGGQKPRIVAHSMGGLITLAVLRKRPELAEKVFFVGVPFTGGIGFLPDLENGDKTGLNRNILAPQVVASFTSVYSFFPDDNHGFKDFEGKDVAVDFFKADEWKKHRLGLMRRPESDAYRQAYESYLPTALERAKIFRKSFQTPGKGKFPTAFVIAAEAHPTLDALRLPKDPKDKPDFESEAKLPGDGLVGWERSRPPADIPYELFKSTATHSQLLNEADVQAFIKSKL